MIASPTTGGPAVSPAAVAGTSLRAYRRMARRRGVFLLALGLALLCSLTIDIAWGPARLSPLEVARAVLTPGAVSDRIQVIVWDIRMPVALMAVLAGAALSIAGAEMQTILNNPLASP